MAEVKQQRPDAIACRDVGVSGSRHSIPIGRVFGITLDLDYSWFLIVGLLTWLLAMSYYPRNFRAGPRQSTGSWDWSPRYCCLQAY